MFVSDWQFPHIYLQYDDLIRLYVLYKSHKYIYMYMIFT